MAGLYIHVPFCRQACHYCDFHFSTTHHLQDDMVNAMIREMELRRDELTPPEIQTIYFGGGTPSLLTLPQLERILQAAHRIFSVESSAEVTLEANPDDLSDDRLSAWKSMGVNRLSIGIQSFRDIDLQYMNRLHSADEARRAVDRARHHGFHDLTLDLIYGTPTMNDEAWAENLDTLKQLELPHFSAYALTVEPRTALATLVRSRSVRGPEEEQVAAQFHQLMQWAADNGYENYEISNFALPGRYSRHNTAYWNGVPYLGIGPSAHSYDGRSRSWNIRNNPGYVRSIQAGELPVEVETLTDANRFNEYVLTSLRTKWGLDKQKVSRDFGDCYTDHLLAKIESLRPQGWIMEMDERVVLTDSGKLFADHVASELFVTE